MTPTIEKTAQKPNIRAMVTGSAGFVGQHLVQHLNDEGAEVIGYNLRSGQNLMDYEMLRNTLDVYRPDYIFHLAAQAFVPESLSNPTRVFEVNTLGSLNLLEAVRQLGLKSRILLAGTSEEYGDAGKDLVTEKTPLQPKSPYAISKIAMDYLGQMYARTHNMHVVVTRAFNHTGPGRGQMYAESSFAKQIVECERGLRGELEHGNLESIRNYTDVRDVVAAYRLAIDLPPDVYNICSDNSVTMQKVLDSLIKNSKVDIKTKHNLSLHRTGDFSFKVPSCEKFTSLTGWKPKYTLDQTMNSLLEYWRGK